ncbi:amidophosphoribosyltransferase [Halobacteriales archaeon SW_7_71_33]|nr:MAG: amidophosphoribosyltransferase [Halobacteriales archaeon SW_7_71_33]
MTADGGRDDRPPDSPANHGSAGAGPGPSPDPGPDSGSDTRGAADRPTEKCGVVGVSVAGEAARPIYYALYALQHRGQESAGVVTHDGFQQHEHVEMGLVGDAVGPDDVERLRGGAGIGHVRYPTAGSVDKACAQPFSVSFRSGALGLSHNGNLVNADELRRELAADGHPFTSDGDTEVIAHDLARHLLEHDAVEAVRRTMERVHGSYSLAITLDDTVMGVRDPQGNRPLCLGELDDGYVLASESAAIDTLGGEFVRDVRPGELVVLEPDGEGYDSHRLVARDRSAHCFFEHVYFARPDSTIDGRLVYEARREMGRRLWTESGIETDVVMPVPDSGRAFASGYAEAASEADAGTEFAEGLMKNRYVGRTFIMPSAEEREQAVRLKLNPIRSTVEGRSVTLIDDSVVRGTTSTELVSLLDDAGAEAVHLRIGSPPIVAPCYMGIDMATREELIAATDVTDADAGEGVADGATATEVEAVREQVGADSLAYLSPSGVAAAIGVDRADLCMACVTGEYPYDIDDEATDRDVQRPAVGEPSEAGADD